MSMLLLTPEGIYASRDRYGRTPITIGQKDGAFCASFENFAYLNLGYHHYSELGPGEIDFITPEGVECLSAPRKEMKMCAFLWAYYGYPTASYEGISVEKMRYDCGKLLARRDKGVTADIVAGVPDSGYCTCSRLCQRIRHSLLPPLHQIYAHLAPVLYALQPEAEEPHC